MMITIRIKGFVACLEHGEVHGGANEFLESAGIKREALIDIKIFNTDRAGLATIYIIYETPD